MQNQNGSSARDRLMDELRQLIHEELNVPLEQLTPDFDLRGEVDVDSLDFVKVLIAVEIRFDVEIPDAEASSIQSLQDMHEVVADALPRGSE
jgi:acyl carrier protein